MLHSNPEVPIKFLKILDCIKRLLNNYVVKYKGKLPKKNRSESMALLKFWFKQYLKIIFKLFPFYYIVYSFTMLGYFLSSR